MKTEINNENKTRFFAQYWLRTYRYKNSFGTFEAKVGDYHFTSHMNHDVCFLILKPLSSITAEDCRFINKLEEWNYDSIDPIRNIILNCIIYNRGATKTHQYDYLRSKGYAIPWMGLSVDEMVQARWIKLREETQ